MIYYGDSVLFVTCHRFWHILLKTAARVPQIQNTTAAETECNTHPCGKVLRCHITNSALKSATIQVGNLQGMGLRATARMLGRSPSTISREVRRNTVPGGTYQVATAQSLMRQRRAVCRPAKKLLLLPDSELFELVVDLLCRYFSPQQIAGTRYALSKSIRSDCFWPRVCKNAAEDYSLAGRALNATNSCSMVSAVEYGDSGRSSWFGTRNLLHKPQARQKGIKP